MQEVDLIASFSRGNNYGICACKTVNVVQEQLTTICKFRLLKVNTKQMDRRKFYEMHDILSVLF